MISIKSALPLFTFASACALAFSSLSGTARATVLTNGGFEDGTAVTNPNNANPWVWSPSTNGERVNALTNDGSDDGDGMLGTHLIDPAYGDWFGYVENSASNGAVSVYQTVDVTIDSPILDFWWQFFTNETAGSGHNDTFEVAAYPAEGDPITKTVATVDGTSMITTNGPLYTPIGTPPGLDQSFARYTSAWTHKTVDLTDMAGQTVTVYFRISDAGAGHSQSSGFAIDNVQFVPEPSSLVLVGLSLGGLALLMWRKSRRS